MNPSRLLSRVLAVVTTAAALAAVHAPRAAEAVVQPCTVTFTSAGGTIAPDTPDDSTSPAGKHVLSAFDIKVADTRLVTDIDVSWDITHADATQVSLHVIGPKTQPNLAPSIQTYNAGMATGALSGRYAFDDEAGTTKLVGPSPAPRTYLPATPAANLEQYPANGGWSLWVLNQAPYAATLHSWTLTLTYATCDTDGDGVEDKVDNCVTAVNVDQANSDDDALGDACDLDIDGDALANAADGCPSVAASTGSGCPVAARTVRLRTPTTDHRLRITVTSPAAGCRDRAEATLFRVRKGRGKDLKLVVATTNARGKARVKAPRRPGRYYVTVARSYAAGEAECASAHSARQRLTRRAATTSYRAVDTDGDGLDDTVDGCPAVASGNPTGCPSAWRKVALKWLPGTRRLEAQVTSPVDACASRARIKLFLDRHSGPDKLLASDASFRGRHRFTVAGGARYYAKVSASYSPGVAECGTATSRRVLVPRR